MATAKLPFVFHEPSGRRWRRFRYAILSAGVVCALLAGLTLVSVVVSPELPTLAFTAGAHGPHVIRTRTVVPTERAGQTLHGPPTGSPPAGTSVRRHVVLGYYVNWDASSIVSLRLNLPTLTHLVSQWFTLQDANGDLKDESDPTVIQMAADARVPILAMVTNFRGGWQTDELHALLADPAARGNLIDNIYSNLLEHRFAGVNVDFEGLRVEDRERMNALMRELRAKLEPVGLLVTQSVPASDRAYDLKTLAALNDLLVVMLYDEHSAAGKPGPVASVGWFEAGLARLAQNVPLERTVIAVGGYGYDWATGAPEAAQVTFASVVSRARSNRAEIQWDEAAGNPVLRYRGDDARQHEVWFLDAVTALNEVRAVARSGFRGVGLWRLGAEDPGVWSVLAHQTFALDEYDAQKLARLDARRAVVQSDEGEVLRIVETPQHGVRKVWRTAGGSFAERYRKYPTYFVIQSAGERPEKVVALTFDDGPDDRYTPQILDILKTRQVPGTFFVVGSQAERLPGLLQRTYAEGHEIGNHTYSHPNLATTSVERTRLELNATQRIIQHTVGVSTILFRPPYHADSEPQTPDEIEPIARAQRLGYVTVAERIDPRDWEPGATADAIVAEVLAERENGRIILLHDGGGDRSATVEALPRLIDELRAAGYRFVPVSELIGKSRAEVMPPYSDRELGWAQIAGLTFGLKGSVTGWAVTLFVATIYLALLRVAVYAPFAVWHTRRAATRRFDRAFAPPVSVIVPAHNEERLIVGTVRSILADGYARFEVVIVDDGSTDRSLEVLRLAFAGDERVRVHSQRKAGKAAALNTGVELARHAIVVAIDADTVLRAGTIEKLVRHFADARVGAVSGNARVGNHGVWLTRFQSIEYICAFNLERRALDVLNAITVVPGAVGAWRKELIGQVGGFTDDTLAEDTDLTLAIRKLGYRIRYEGEAVAYTEVPQAVAGLAKQRFRWLFGTLQAAWKHRSATFRLRHGSLGFVALPSIWLFQLVLPLLSPVAELAMLLALLTGNWQVVLLYCSLLFAVELVGALVAYGLEGARRADLLLLFAQRVFYRQLLFYVSAKAIVCAIRGRRIDWHKLDRGLSRPAPTAVNR